MDKKRVSAHYSEGNKRIKVVNLDLYLWEESDIYYVYAPALDLTGYGLTKDEADISFDAVLEEFLVYTDRKGTIYDELENLGWAINKKKKKIIAPLEDELLNGNEEFNNLIKSGNYTKSTSNVRLAVA